MQLEVSVVEISDLASGVLAEELDGLLSSAALNRDADIELFALARRGAELVGCLGLAGEVIKCAAVAKSDRGRNLLAPLLTEVRYAALARGRPKLFVYTSPNNREIFTALGFRALAEVPKLVVLMEDDPHGIERYQTTLAKSRRDVEPVGSVVLNANPLTLGHQYLIGRAAEECEVVHVFVVGTDRSEFSYAERLAMVSAGVGEMPQRDRIIVPEIGIAASLGFIIVTLAVTTAGSLGKNHYDRTTTVVGCGPCIWNRSTSTTKGWSIQPWPNQVPTGDQSTVRNANDRPSHRPPGEARSCARWGRPEAP